jgi:hypothetical protein
MILADPLIFTKPLHVWLGMVIFLLVVFQILTGSRIIKVPLWIHMKLVWIIILGLALVHGFYGFEIYFLK